MAITPTKTWEYSIDHAHTGASITDRNRELWLKLKELLTDTGSISWVDPSNAAIGAGATSPWVVVASSDSVTADATDRWVDTGDIVGAAAGVAHSWIHLRQVDYFGVGDHLNLLLAVENAGNCALGWVAFNRGALGWNADGTITNRPTTEAGTFPIQVRDGVSTSGTERTSDQMWGSDSINNQAVLQFRMSDDGQCGGWWLFSIGNCIAEGGWQRDEDGPSRTNDWICWYGGADNNVEINTWDDQWNTDNNLQTLDDSNVEQPVLVGAAGFGSLEVQLMENNDGLDGTRFYGQIPLVAEALSACLGVWSDRWWGSVNNVSGDGAPLTPPVVWRSIGHQIIPWPSGAAMQVS